jgi:hypothetical protein
MDRVASLDRERLLLVRSLWLVAGAMAAHELEEWNIARWSARNFTNHTGITDQAIWVGLVVVTTIFVTWIHRATRMASPTAISLVALPAFALVAVGNAVQHVTWTVLFSEYAPGVVSSVLLVVPTSILAMGRMVKAGRLFLLPIGACAVLWATASVQIIQAGRLMQPFQVVLQRFFIAFANALGLPGSTGAV